MLFIAAIVITFSVTGYSRTYMKYNISAIFTNGDKTDSSSQLRHSHQPDELQPDQLRV